MSLLSDVYGSDYKEAAVIQSLSYAVGIIASNIVNLNLTTKFECTSLWNGNNMKMEAIKLLINRVSEKNSSGYNKLHLTWIPKTSNKVNMYPYLIDGPVEYFRLVDLSTGFIYLLYITPNNHEAY